MAEAPAPYDLAISVLAVAGSRMGGLWLRARPSGARDLVLRELERVMPETARIAPTSDDFVLFGGIDVAASLATGRKTLSEGALAKSGRVTLTNAERASAGLSGRLAGVLDAQRHTLVALDEGAEEDETLPDGLSARLGLFVSLDGVRAADVLFKVTRSNLAQARQHFKKVSISADIETKLAEVAGMLAVDEPRHLLAARHAARALAALDERSDVTEEDLTTAISLVLLPRACTMPTDVIQPKIDKAAPNSDLDHEATTSLAPEDKVVGSEAVHLADILAMASASAPKRSASAGAGGTKAGALRGRPLPSRPSRLGHGQRIDPVASIRAALPWQRLRPPSPRGQRIAFRASDLRMRRYETRTGRVVIFAVDASGSQAMARMAEAKGAVECLLAEAYRRRDEVALIAFRGQNAELLLPPTRALVRARSALAALPGGGGTPLAAGLKTAHALAASVQSKGGTPLIVLLSDGRANVALDGEGHRKHAKADAEAVAGVLKAAQFNSLVLDTGRRPDPHLFEFADKLGGQYVPLPSADAKAMSAAVSAVMDP